jgi:phage shock protein C
MIATRQLRRLNTSAVIGGVCAGLGHYFGIDANMIRLAWALAAVLGGAGVLAYLVAWLALPDEDGRHTLTPLIFVVVLVVLPLLMLLLYFVPITPSAAP